MKWFILVLWIGFVASLPKPTKVNFRNLYKKSDVEFHPSPHIIGGEEVKPHSIPYQAFLDIYDSDDGGWHCGGTLISENYVLTAGHCLNGVFYAYVTLGLHVLYGHEDTQILIKGKRFKVHEKFDENLLLNDIGIIQLQEAVKLTEAIQIAKLPSKADKDQSYAGTIGTISGWGVTEPGWSNQVLSQVLKKVDVRVMSNEECEKTFKNLLSSSNVCTSGEEDSGSCYGDSGGPLTSNGVLIGLVSFGVVDCPFGAPSAFTRITSFLDWIEENSDLVF